MMEEENHGQNGESSVAESKRPRPSTMISNDAVFTGKQLSNTYLIFKEIHKPRN